MTACISPPSPVSARSSSSRSSRRTAAPDSSGTGPHRRGGAGARPRAPSTGAARHRPRCRRGARPRSRPGHAAPDPGRGRRRASRRGAPRAQAPGGPDDRVGDVRLPGAVRPDDDGHSRLEPHLDRIRERLEAAQLDRAQEHAPQSDAARTAGLVHEGRFRDDSTGSGAARPLPPVAQRPCLRGREASASRAALCSAAFFDAPSPTPACSPSTTAAHVKCRSCGGPSTSRTT